MMLLVCFCQFHTAGPLNTPPTATPDPEPTIPAINAHIKYTSCGNFEFRGSSNGEFIRTCYNTHIQVDGIISDSASDCLPHSMKDVTLTTLHP
jgi:hypothetical protein